MRAASRLSITFFAILCCAAANETRSATTAPEATAKATPLFSYEEDGDTLSFFPPRTVDLVRAAGSKAKSCRGELPDHGNMWSGAEVERAFRDGPVQKALGGAKAPYAAEYAGKLTAGETSIVWAGACKKCQAAPAALEHLHEVLHTVIRNRRLVCQ